MVKSLDMFTFLKEVRAEMGKVTFPSRNDVTRLTLLVIGISVLVGIYLGGSDYMFTSLLGLIVR